MNVEFWRQKMPKFSLGHPGYVCCFFLSVFSLITPIIYDARYTEGRRDTPTHDCVKTGRRIFLGFDSHTVA